MRGRSYVLQPAIQNAMLVENAESRMPSKRLQCLNSSIYHSKHKSPVYLLYQAPTARNGRRHAF